MKKDTLLEPLSIGDTKEKGKIPLDMGLLIIEFIKKKIILLFSIKKNAFGISRKRIKELKKELIEKKQKTKGIKYMRPIFFKEDGTVDQGKTNHYHRGAH